MDFFCILSRRWTDLGFITSCSVDVTPIPKKLVGSFHRHTAEIGNKVGTVGVASDIALRTLASIFASKREHITAVATPVSTDVCERFEAMRDAMINLFFVTFLRLRSE
jgi:hypothetical protein